MNPLTRIAVRAGMAAAVLLSASFGAKAQAIVYTYGYQVSQDGSTWEFQINGIKGGRVEKIKGGVNFSQDMQCQEIYELGEVRKTDFDLGSGVWYLNKTACDKAKKASSTKSPGSC